ncbi:MAG: hypothetical protein ACE5H9_10870 [Anaerolineae bacterium]
MTQQDSDPLRQNISWYGSLLLVLIIAIVPTALCGLFYLSRVPDVTWRRGDLTHDRLWLARVPQPIGLGFESQRPATSYSDHEVCVEVNVRFLLWSRPGDFRQDQNVSYSQVLVLTERGWQPNGQDCR